LASQKTLNKAFVKGRYLQKKTARIVIKFLGIKIGLGFAKLLLKREPTIGFAMPLDKLLAKIIN
jgi:hypothetical protein